MEENMINLTQLAEMQGVTKRAVQKQWNKHKDDEAIQGHYEIRGNNSVWLDDKAVEYLKTFMNNPNPIVVYDKKNTELLEEINVLQKRIISLYDEKESLRLQAAEQLRLIEAHQTERQQIQEDLVATVNQNEQLQIDLQTERDEKKKAFAIKDRFEAELEKAAELNEALQRQTEEQAAEIERLRNRSLWSRIRNR